MKKSTVNTQNLTNVLVTGYTGFICRVDNLVPRRKKFLNQQGNAL